MEAITIACFETKLDSRFDHLAERHPCLGRAKNAGRIHLPISPMCNIKCRFCQRSFNDTENRPGVTGQILDVREAVSIIDHALELCPEITVAGVAGPGDSLATNHALDALSQIHVHHPTLIGCLSTNGLLLPDKAQAIADAGVGSVTVTVNAVDPFILEQIVSHVIYEGKILTGIPAAEVLSARQLSGIEAAANLGLLVKVNTVLIPDINGEHIGDIARTAKERGASIINLIPLIPQGEFADMDEPTCVQLNAARQEAEEWLPVFRHCQHCRADACGILGKTDVSGQLYGKLQCENTFSHG